jgi:hypothetical protein
MNKYLFRGQTKETHEWVYGGIFVQGDRYFIIKSITYECGATSWGAFEVDPNTVGQFTGLIVRDNEKVFDGDSIIFGGQTLVVYWNGETCSWQAKKIHAPYPYRRFPHENWDYIDLGWIAAEPIITGEMTTQVNNNNEPMCAPEIIDEDVSWDDVF